MTAEFTSVRYEPVPPPILMLRAAPVEGESVDAWLSARRCLVVSAARPRVTSRRRKLHSC